MIGNTNSPDTNHTLTGTRLGKYQIRSVIGQGGMGTVYEAYDAALDRLVALKVMAPHLAWQEGFVERFLREARAAARLRHPNIVTIYDVGRSGGWYYFAMDYVKGRTLAQVIETQGPASLEDALRILRPLGEGLDYAHSQGLVHRDIKPSNVIVSAGGDVTLTDFGIARATAAARLTGTGVVMGTPEYMAPEQACGADVVPQTDQYALGVIAYEMLTGRAPFQAKSTATLLYKIVNDPPPPLRAARPDLPAQAERTLERALAKNPGDRFGTCAEFLAALAGTLRTAEDGPVPQPRARRKVEAAPREPSPTTKRRSRLLLGLGGVAIALIGLLCLAAAGIGVLLILSRTADTPTTPILSATTAAPFPATATPSVLQELTATPGPPATPAAVPTDPPLARDGTILFYDDFEDPASGWEVGSWDGGSVGYRDGRYSVIAAGQAEWMWGAAFRFFTDVMIEVEATQVSAGPTDNNDYGVGCRVQPNGDGYHLVISGDGYYAIFLREDGVFTPLVPFEPSDAVRQGNATNHILAVCDGPLLVLFANDELLATAVDGTFVDGDIVLSATSFEDAPTEILFDDLVVYDPRD